MVTVVRLTRRGCRNNPSYRIVKADSRSPRDGKFLEDLGYFSPLIDKSDYRYLYINKERLGVLKAQGVRVTPRVEKLLKKVLDVKKG